MQHAVHYWCARTLAICSDGALSISPIRLASDIPAARLVRHETGAIQLTFNIIATPSEEAFRS